MGSISVYVPSSTYVWIHAPITAARTVRAEAQVSAEAPLAGCEGCPVATVPVPDAEEVREEVAVEEGALPTVATTGEVLSVALVWICARRKPV